MPDYFEEQEKKLADIAAVETHSLCRDQGSNLGCLDHNEKY